MEFVYNTRGTCSSQIIIDIADDKTIKSVRFIGGCNGNLKGIAKLVEGQKIDDIIKYGWDNFEHEIVYENLSQREAQEKEIELIFKYKTWIGFEDCCGYNTSITSTGPSPKKI